MTVTIDRNLNLIIPIERDSGLIYVHVMPLGRAAFENNFQMLARTWEALHANGISGTSAPQIAYLMLRQIAQDMGLWEGPSGVENSLVNEVIRLSNIVMPGERGWQSVALFDALRTNILDEDEADEVRNAIIFFSVAWWIYPRRQIRKAITMTGHFWRWPAKSLALMEFIKSLPTSTPAENTGEMPPQPAAPTTRSSIPY